MSADIADLIERARRGDETAREELFRCCRDYVAFIARAQAESWLRTKVDASDMVQQTLLDAHQGFADFRGRTEAEWLAWLRQIVRRNATDFVRRYGTAQKRRAGREVSLDAPRGEDEGTWEPPGSEDTPSLAFARQEDQLRVAEALTKLSEDHREVIILRNLERLPFDEVARRMGRTRGAVQMLWVRALEKLKQLLAEPPAA